MEENEIIKSLKKMPARDIYYIAPREYFIRGYEYYRSGRVLYFEWEEDGGLLVAGIKGENVFEVFFYIYDNRLSYKCTCPVWSAQSNCKHVVCAMAAIMNILDPEVLDSGQQSAEYRRMFTNILASGDKNMPLDCALIEDGSSYSIVIGQQTYGLRPGISIEKNNRAVPASEYPRLPAELREIINVQRYFYLDKDKLFKDYLNCYGNRSPIIVDTGKDRIPVEWESNLIYSTRTRIDVTDGVVTLSRVCFNDDGECTDPYLFGGIFLVDLRKRKMGVIKEKDAWLLWRSIVGSITQAAPHESFNESGENDYYFSGGVDYGHIRPLQISLKKFNQYQLVLYGDMGSVIPHLILSINGEDTLPVQEQYSYSISIYEHRGRDGEMVVKAGCNFSGFRGSTTRASFEFIKNVISGRLTSAPLRARKRVLVLLKTFLSLLTSETRGKPEKIIRDALSEGDFQKRAIRNEAKRTLMYEYSRSRAPSFRVQFNNDCWYLVSSDINMEALLYTVPYEIFGHEIFERMTEHDEMVLNSVRLFKRLPELYLRLKGHNISLLLKGKLVRSAKWDFSFDCIRNSGIDWFEIRPEIKSDNNLIDEELFHAALEGNGVVEREEFIEILDQNSNDILQSIASLYRGNKKSDVQVKEIVQVPRLRILDWIYLRNSGVEVNLPDEDEELIERLTSFEKIEKRDLPSGLRANLRHYQMDGYYWLSFLYEHRLGACLADDMGLGKTLQAISLLAGIKEGTVKSAQTVVHRQHLIVLPPSLLFNWEREIERFFPDLKMHLYTGKDRTADFGEADVVLTTYGLVRRDIEILRGIQFNVIIFDEAQSIKNIYADTTGAVRQLNGYFKLTMTGTPVENHLGEYFSILDLSIPGLLGDYDDFKSSIRLESSPELEVILRRTRPFVLRRTKEAILKELPPKTESDIYLELTEKQKSLYIRTVDMVKSTIEDAYENKTKAQAQIIALTAILKLRQLCVSPGLIDPAFNEASPKIDFLINKLKELMDEGHSALVFSQFTSFLDILERDLKENDISFCRLDGSTAVGRRKKLVEGFQEGTGAKIFLLSLKAGGQGLNLTKASYVFHLDPWWNPAVENQASDRAHRIGQKNKVTIMRILMRHTIEEKMMDLKVRKLALYKAVMEDSTQAGRGLSISKSDFDYLLG